MEELLAPSIFIYDEFIIEDGDGLNLVIMDAQRMALEAKFHKLLKEIEPVEIRNETIFYKLSDLETCFDKAKKITNYRAKG